MTPRTAASVTQAALPAIREHRGNFRTITFDNGTEFHDYKALEKHFALKCYFAASLPGMIGSSKVAFQSEVLFKSLVVMELCAVVEGDGPEIAPMLSDRGKSRLGHGSSSARGHLANDHQA